MGQGVGTWNRLPLEVVLGDNDRIHIAITQDDSSRGSEKYIHMQHITGRLGRESFDYKFDKTGAVIRHDIGDAYKQNQISQQMGEN